MPWGPFSFDRFSQISQVFPRMHQLPRTTRAPLALHAAARTHRVLCWPSWASGTGKGTCEEPRGLRCFVGQFRPVPFGGTGPRPRSQWRPCLGLFMRTSIHHNHTSHQSTIHINPSQSLVVERAPKSHDSQTPRRVGRPCVPSPLRPTPPERRPSEDGAMPLRLFPR